MREDGAGAATCKVAVAVTEVEFSAPHARFCCATTPPLPFHDLFIFAQNIAPTWRDSNMARMSISH